MIPHLDTRWIGTPTQAEPDAICKAIHNHMDASGGPGGSMLARLGDQLISPAEMLRLLRVGQSEFEWPDDEGREHFDLLRAMLEARLGARTAVDEVVDLLRRRTERLARGLDSAESSGLRLRFLLAEAAWRRSAYGLPGRPILPSADAEGAEQRISVCGAIPLSGDPQTDKRLREMQILHDGVRLLPSPPPARMAQTLSQEMPQAGAVISWIRGTLELRGYAGQRAFGLPPLLLHGPPGTGKSHLARRIAEVAGMPHRVLSVAGSSDVRMLLGTSRGWSSGQASFPALTMARLDAANAVVVVDEIDKAQENSTNGSWLQGVLAFLEPVTARGLLDEFLGVEVDTRHISWIFTANDVTRLPSALRSRLACFSVEAPGTDALPALVERLLGGIAAELGTELALLPVVSPESTALIRREFARNRCLRRLKAMLRLLLANEVRARVLH